uniref:ATP-binding subunit of clp protease n=1 Tax=Skeletonema pseudocostatum TaxID=41457 RepID=A0A650D0G5_9STRA|nr:Clp protease ATP binding subunit [Skeletonema pseudocostatum]QGR23551.1 ATP-binding subunit of clp protease [Skeletonema pseudocostatum]UAM91935.1 Clp protease ATP binding subunit [Skeletonema pseudocostatum]
MFEKFTEGAIKVIMLAQEEARRMGHNFVGTEQLLLGVIGQRHGIGGRALAQLNITLKKTRKEIEKYIGRGTGFVASEIPFTPRAKRVLEMSIHEGQDLGVNYVGTEHVLLSLINEADGIAMRTLDKLRVNIPKLRQLILTYIEEQQEDILKPPLTDQEKWAIAREKSGLKTPSLDLYTEDITKEVIGQRLDPVIGRDEEINALVKVLGRRRKNNPVLVGEAGVGKTACAEGLAILMQSLDCPEFLLDHVVRALDLGSVLAGTKYRGEFEERMKHIIEEVNQHGKTILVIDEIHTLVGAGAAEGAVDAANLLKPSLARGTLRLIGATTLDEYRRYIEKDPALERRFHSILVEEPSVETTIDILKGLKPEFQRHHALTYSDAALIEAAKQSSRFIADRNLPDKAIDVIDEAGSRVRLRNQALPSGLVKLLVELHDTLQDKNDAINHNDFATAKLLVEHEIEVRTHIRIMRFALTSKEKYAKYSSPNGPRFDEVTEGDISKVISAWTGIPVTKINQSENQRLKLMEKILHERLIGQHHAITAVSKAVRRARVGIQDPKRPIASFIFAGPTGVGKTELTKTLAEYMFDDEKSLIRFDMSEFMERHTVAKLIGSPPGYVGFQDGGQLTEAVRQKPYSIVLFDEVEKAHPDVFNIFLQILDDGHLSDSSGKIISFKNTIIVMTTNLGSRVIEKESPILSKEKMGFGRHHYNIGSERENKKIELLVHSDGTFSLKPPVEPEITPEDEEKFVKITGLVQEELKKFFRPEFLNRVDDIIVFNHLSKHDIWQICGLMLKSLCGRLKEQGATLNIDNAARYFLTEEGYDPIYGARPLRRSITKFLEDKLAEACLSNVIHEGTHINVTQQIKPSIYGNRPVYSPVFEDIYTSEILVEFDHSYVDFSEIESKEEKNSKKQEENTVSTN